MGKDNIFGRYTYWNPHNGDSDPFGTKTGAGPTGNYTQEVVLGDNHVFNPSSIADLHLSYLENYNFQNPLSEGFAMSSISPNYGTIQTESENQEGLLPGLGIQGYSIGAELSQLYWNNNVWATQRQRHQDSRQAHHQVGRQLAASALGELYNSQGLGHQRFSVLYRFSRLRMQALATRWPPFCWAFLPAPASARWAHGMHFCTTTDCSSETLPGDLEADHNCRPALGAARFLLGRKQPGLHSSTQRPCDHWQLEFDHQSCDQHPPFR